MVRYVVAGIDGSERSLAAADWAAREAVLRGLPLRLVHASPLAPHMLPTVHGSDGWRDGARHMMERAVSHLTRSHPGVQVEGRLATDTPAAVLAGEGRSAELVVLGTRGLGGFRELLLGSVALETVAQASCPVVLVPAGPPAEDRLPEVVVGIDARNPDDGATDFAFDAARRREAKLHAVHAWSLSSMYCAPWGAYAVTEEDRAEWEDVEVQLLHDALRGWREKYPTVPVLTDVRLLGPADALVKASADADLLVVGRGTGPTGRLSGVVHAVAHHARCPVVFVPCD